jgi:hypothetical protein
MTASSTLENILPLLTDGHNYGSYLSGCCPWHGDKSPSLLVNERGFNCQACGKRGSLLYLFRKLEGKPYKPELKRKYGFSWRQGAEYIWSESFAIMKSNPDLSVYLCRDRGITYDTIARCQIGYFRGWYIIPLFENGEFVQAVARAGSVIESDVERYSNSPGKAMLYAPNESRDRDHSYTLAPFGILDSISLYDCGFPSVTSISGKDTSSGVYDQLRKKIYVIPDRGEMEEARRLADSLGWRGHLIELDYPEGCKDANDFLKMGRRMELIRQIRKGIK